LDEDYQVGSNAAIDSNPDTVYGMASVTLNSGVSGRLKPAS